MQMKHSLGLSMPEGAFVIYRRQSHKGGNQKGDISNWYSFILTESLLFTIFWLRSQFRPFSTSEFLPVLFQHRLD